MSFLRSPHRRRLPTLLFAGTALLGGCERIEVDPDWAAAPLPTANDPVDPAMAEVGGALYRQRCAACHRLDGQPLVGPPLEDVVERRSPEWIRGIVLNPDSMLRSDAEARALLERYQVPMPDTGLGHAGLRAVLEYLRGVAARTGRETGIDGEGASPE